MSLEAQGLCSSRPRATHLVLKSLEETKDLDERRLNELYHRVEVRSTSRNEWDIHTYKQKQSVSSNLPFGSAHTRSGYSRYLSERISFQTIGMARQMGLTSWILPCLSKANARTSELEPLRLPQWAGLVSLASCFRRS